VILAFTAALAIVVQDHAALRAAPRTGGTELERLWQGDVLEVRGEQAGYLKVYDHRHERGGYVREDAGRRIELTETAASDLLAVLRFLRDSPGSEALGISYGAAYLKAAPAQAITAEPFDAIAQMAERLADRASGAANLDPNLAAHLEVVEQFGIHMRSVERNGRVRMCYDGELFHRVLSFPGAQAEARARAVLGLTRSDCIDPAVDPLTRAAADVVRARLLDEIKDDDLSTLTRSRLHARRAVVWAAVAYATERGAIGPGASAGEPGSVGTAAERALSELIAVHADDLGEDLKGEYLDALVRVSAGRWAGSVPAPQPGPFMLSALPGDPGQTCVTLRDARRPNAEGHTPDAGALTPNGGARPPNAGALIRRCTYGLVRMASLQSIPRGPALVLAVQPLDSWRELWVFRESADGWTIDVISPGLDDPQEGYVDFAGYVPGSRRLLIAREVKDRGRFRLSFEELRLDDLALVRQASHPELLPDFGRWQDVTWRRESLALH
jgi:hypothetical protein